MDETLLAACRDLLDYHRTVLQPAADEFNSRLGEHSEALHHAFGTALLTGHTVDYILAVRRTDGEAETRSGLVKKFDEIFSVPGARIANSKFRIVDAVANSIKHIALDKTRYPDLISRYGPISFRCLTEEGGASYLQPG